MTWTGWTMARDHYRAERDIEECGGRFRVRRLPDGPGRVLTLELPRQRLSARSEQL